MSNLQKLKAYFCRDLLISSTQLNVLAQDHLRQFEISRFGNRWTGEEQYMRLHWLANCRPLPYTMSVTWTKAVGMCGGTTIKLYFFLNKKHLMTSTQQILSHCPALVVHSCSLPTLAWSPTTSTSNSKKIRTQRRYCDWGISCSNKKILINKIFVYFLTDVRFGISTFI